MSMIPTIQESNIIDWDIVSPEVFWWPIEKWIPAPYFNNFASYFEAWWRLHDFKDFLDKDSWNFTEEKIQEYTLKETESAMEETRQRVFIRYCSFAEYYQVFPQEIEKLIWWSNNHEELSNEVCNFVAQKVHSLTDWYRDWLYHAYAYMRTQPWTSDAILTS